MHEFTVTVALIDVAGSFDFVTRVIRAGHVYEAIERATSFSLLNRVVYLVETEVVGRVTTWLSLDELEINISGIIESGKLPG